MSVIAVDFGSRHHGLAGSDPLGISVQPLEAIDATGEAAALDAIARAAREREAELVVVGLPVDMSGREGPAAAAAREFARKLREATNLPVELWDERLSTEEAERHLRESGLSGSRRRKMVDSASAVVILRGYLDAKGGAR